ARTPAVEKPDRYARKRFGARRQAGSLTLERRVGNGDLHVSSSERLPIVIRRLHHRSCNASLSSDELVSLCDAPTRSRLSARRPPTERASQRIKGRIAEHRKRRMVPGLNLPSA